MVVVYPNSEMRYASLVSSDEDRRGRGFRRARSELPYGQ
jgi:hypothetical protein